MTQLTDDCFAFGGALLPLADAQARIAARFGCVVGEQRVALAASVGRVLARDVVAAMDLPGQTNSAVDGYAVHFADLAWDGPTDLPVFGRVSAGCPAETRPKTGKIVGPSQAKSAKCTAYPSTAEFASTGKSIPDTKSRAKTRPTAPANPIRCSPTTHENRAAIRACASANGNNAPPNAKQSSVNCVIGRRLWVG